MNFVFFKQETAYEIRISDWSSDVCSSDLLSATEAMLGFAQEHGLARLTMDAGYGFETVWEPVPVTVKLGEVLVPFLPGAFLQATRDGQDALVSAASEWLDGVPTVADLFSGLGTFAFALAGSRIGEGTKVLAAEAARDKIGRAHV